MQKVLDWLATWGVWYEGWSKTGIAVALLALVSIAGFCAKVALWLHDLVKRRREVREAERARRGEARQSFSEKMLREATNHFVEQDCSNLDPAKELDLRSSVGVQESVVKVVERELQSGNTSHILILADSGMGKTTLMLNLLSRDLARGEGRCLGMVTISLAWGDALPRIAAIGRKYERILLLDAFDEDPHAISDHVKRLAELMQAARDFAAVVVTCRTQFFTRDEEIPRDVGVIRIEPRPAGQDQAMTFRKLYLKPYNREQVSEYLRRTVPWWQFRTRRKAHLLATRMHDLVARPMLLALVPELARTQHKITEIFQLYNFMVESWFHRERTWIDRKTLRAASKLLAVEMYIHRQERGSESLPRAEIGRLVADLGTDLQHWHLERRSLLNRDNSDDLKFAHRSILEYFFVVSAIEGDPRALAVVWTDQMREFLFSWARVATPEKSRAMARRIIGSRAQTGSLIPSPVAVDGDETGGDALQRHLAALAPSGTGFPDLWRAEAVKIEYRLPFAIVYDVADGTIWRTSKHRQDGKDERGRFFNFDDIYGPQPIAGTPEVSESWFGPFRDSLIGDSPGLTCTLPQFLRLVRSLAYSARLWDVIESTDRYWVRSSSRSGWHLISVRKESAIEPADSAPGSVAKVVHRQVFDVNGQRLQFTLYRSSSRNEKARLVLAEDFCEDDRFVDVFPHARMAAAS
jgi:hypothetical protein